MREWMRQAHRHCCLREPSSPSHHWSPLSPLRRHWAGLGQPAPQRRWCTRSAPRAHRTPAATLVCLVEAFAAPARRIRGTAPVRQALRRQLAAARAVAATSWSCASPCRAESQRAQRIWPIDWLAVPGLRLALNPSLDAIERLATLQASMRIATVGGRATAACMERCTTLACHPLAAGVARPLVGYVDVRRDDREHATVEARVGRAQFAQVSRESKAQLR
eukprot:scaffold175051_cov27-Tisochrysis_lutea.AAC.2